MAQSLCSWSPNVVRSKIRGRSGTVVASGQAAEAPVRSNPLTKLDLVKHFSSGCKPKEKWRIGTEHEKFGFEVGNLQSLRYDKIVLLLEGMAENFGWQKVMEEDRIVALKRPDGSSVTLEGGGQVELSGAPLKTLHETRAETDAHLRELKYVAEPLGIKFLGMGFHPKSTLEETPVMPRHRFAVLNKFLPRVGKYDGLEVMFRTCSIQANLDFCSEADMVKKLRVGLALQPVATAMFANSPFREGSPTGYLSYRNHLCTDFDPARTGDLPFVFHSDFGFEKFIDYALDVPMVFAYRNRQYVDCIGLSFRDFMAGKLPNLPGEVANLGDWENHLTTIYPQVRIKRFLEMRGADAVPWITALPALWVGLLYDDESLDAAYEMIKDWSESERAMLRLLAPKLALKTPFRGGTLRDVAQDVLKLSKRGLDKRGFNEAQFLNELTEIVDSGVTLAERLLKRYTGEWKNNVDHAFEEMTYF